jgi:hypothetical protein
MKINGSFAGSIGARPSSATSPRSSSPSRSPSSSATSSSPGASPSSSKPIQPDFLPAKEKVSIVSLDNSEIHVTAQYNPKELGISKSVNWQDPKRLDNRAADKRSPTEAKDAEFTGGGARTMSLELFFDRYEVQNDKSQIPIEQLMDDLNTMASISDPAGKPEDRRPHYCLVVWGAGGIRPFRCVIESLDIKYTMFSSAGIPLRAVATVKVKEAALQVKEQHKREADDVKKRPDRVNVKKPWDES